MKQAPPKSATGAKVMAVDLDQAKVDEFISKGVNSVERKPFRPMRLMLLLMGVVLGLSILSQLIARWAGVY